MLEEFFNWSALLGVSSWGLPCTATHVMSRSPREVHTLTKPSSKDKTFFVASRSTLSCRLSKEGCDRSFPDWAWTKVSCCVLAEVQGWNIDEEQLLLGPMLDEDDAVEEINLGFVSGSRGKLERLDGRARGGMDESDAPPA